MLFKFPKNSKAPAAFVLATVFLLHPAVFAEDHVVPAAELHKQVRSAVRTRASDLAKVKRFLSSEAAAKALKGARLDPASLQKAVPFLSDEELARLASQTEKIQQDFAAGALNNQQLTYIIIALATAVIVLLIVEA